MSGDTPRRLANQPSSTRLWRVCYVPLVRLLIRSGIAFPMLTELLRELYVNVAEYDFALLGKEQTDSRVSLLTGVHRKEVRRLRGAGAPVNAVPATVSQTSRILARWLADPDFRCRRSRSSIAKPTPPSEIEHARSMAVEG